MFRLPDGFMDEQWADVLIDWPNYLAPIIFVMFFVLRLSGRLRSVPLQLAFVAFPGLIFASFVAFVLCFGPKPGERPDAQTFFYCLAVLYPSDIVCPPVFVYGIARYLISIRRIEERETFTLMQSLLMVLLVLSYFFDHVIISLLNELMED
jgi:hypothetical protein